MALAAILAMVPVGSTIATGFSTGGSPARGAEVGNLAPDFQLANLDGQPVSLSDFRGKPVLVNFWTSWCPPCRAEMSFIEDTFTDKKWADKGLVVLAINIGESQATVEEFVREYGLTFLVLLDIKQDVTLEYYIRAIPATFFIDGDGIIRETRIGAFSGKSDVEKRLAKIVP